LKLLSKIKFHQQTAALDTSPLLLRQCCREIFGKSSELFDDTYRSNSHKG